MSAEAEEIIGDFVEITRIEPSPVTDAEAERALMELVEYIRAATLLVAEELGTFAELNRSLDEHRTIH